MASLNVIGAVIASAIAVATVQARDPTFKACDTASNAHEYTRSGTGFTWWKSDDPVFYVTPGLGSCGETYRDSSDVACVAPGWVDSANINACNNWIEVVNDKTGHSVSARVLDTCGAVAGTTFGCNDIYLSKHTFMDLAGDDANAAVDRGRLDTTVSWRFIKEPCDRCYEGYPGKTLTGTDDDCQGYGPFGYLRCGRRSGNQRITDPAELKKVCYKSKNTC